MHKGYHALSMLLGINPCLWGYLKGTEWICGHVFTGIVTAITEQKAARLLWLTCQGMSQYLLLSHDGFT